MQCHFQIPYGVCEIESGGILKGITEKPGYDILINTGMYVMDSRILSVIPKNTVFDMNILLEVAKKKGYRIGVFPIGEHSWLDIGQWEEYRKVVDALRV